MSINKNSQKTPNLRFKGFTDDWEQRKLGELVSIKGRIGFRGYTREDIVSKDDGVLTFSPGNIDNNQIKISDNNTYITRNKYMESPEIMIENNDILFVKTGSTLGKSAIIRNFKEEATINPQIVLFKEISINQEYLSNYLVSKYIQKQISSVRIGGAIPTLTETAIGNLIIWVPSSKEQDVIGRFFRNLDDTITLHQRKLDQLNQLKEALLQQMFPGKGETVPKLRFAGFEGEWEERKLGDYLKIPNKTKVNVQSKDELMTLKLNLGGLEAGSNRDTLALGSTVYYRRKAGQFIYGKQNFFNGSMAIIPLELDGKATSGDVPSLDIVGISTEYLFTYVSRDIYWKTKEAKASGTGSKRIHEKNLGSSDFMVEKGL